MTHLFKHPNHYKMMKKILNDSKKFGVNCTDKEKRIIEYGIKIFGTPNVLEIQHPKLRPLIRKYLNLKP